MTDREAESFAVGVSIWEEILPAAPRDDPEAIARRYCACLMLHSLYQTLTSAPRREALHLRRLLEYLNGRPSLT